MRAFIHSAADYGWTVMGYIKFLWLWLTHSDELYIVTQQTSTIFLPVIFGDEVTLWIEPVLELVMLPIQCSKCWIIGMFYNTHPARSMHEFIFFSFIFQIFDHLRRISNLIPLMLNGGLFALSTFHTYIHFICVCVCLFVCMRAMCEQVPMEDRSVCRILCSRSYRWLPSSLTGVLTAELGSSTRAASTLNLWSISLALLGSIFIWGLWTVL